MGSQDYAAEAVESMMEEASARAMTIGGVMEHWRVAGRSSCELVRGREKSCQIVRWIKYFREGASGHRLRETRRRMREGRDR